MERALDHDRVTFVSTSLGHWHEKTGIAIVERTLVPTDEPYNYVFGGKRVRSETRVDVRVEYHARFLERHGPPSRIAKVSKRLGGIAQSITGDLVVMVDITVTGMQACNKILKEATAEGRPWRSFKAAPVNVSGAAGGLGRTAEKAFTLPRRDLIASSQMLFDEERLKIADDLSLATTLRAELLSFRDTAATRKPESLEGWREGAADDLVLAVAMPVWCGQQYYGSPAYVVLPEHGPFRSLPEESGGSGHVA